MKNVLNKLCSKVACALVTREKKESGDHLVQILGTILIAIIVLVLFKDKIVEIITSVFTSVSGSMNTLFNPS